VATVGRRAVDGSFEDFVAALNEPVFGGSLREPAVTWRARDGRVLDLAWSQPFTVDGSPAGLGPDGRPETPPHLDNPACRQEFGAGRLEIEWAGEQLIIDNIIGRRLVPDSGVPLALTTKEI
jgi:hypothetical protein